MGWIPGMVRAVLSPMKASFCGHSTLAPERPRPPRRAPHRELSALWTVTCALALLAGCEPGTLGARDAAVAVERDAGGPSDASLARDAARPADGSAPDAPTDGPTEPTECPCFDGPGEYCEAAVLTEAADLGCAVPGAREGGAHLFSCGDAGWSMAGICSSGCESGETGASAACALPLCDCFIRASWCGASAGRHALSLDPPCRVPLASDHAEDLLGCAGDRFVVLEACAEGCVEMPTGTADVCRDTRDSGDPGWPDCAHHALLRSGLHPEASDRLRCAGVGADRISQTIGYASASAGYHAPDGTAGGLAYTAAVDLRTRDLGASEIRALLDRLGRNGFAAWYRQPGSDGWPSAEAPHIHAVFAGVVMKAELRGQVRDFLVGRNGLSSHATYRFWVAPGGVRETVRLLFARHYTP